MNKVIKFAVKKMDISAEDIRSDADVTALLRLWTMVVSIVMLAPVALALAAYDLSFFF